MANIKTRILQILGQKNALQLDQLIESVRDIALIQDKIKLDETRIKIIINQLLKAGIILEFEGKLMINNPTNMSRVHSNQGINITYYPTGQSCTMGSPGMTIGNTTMTFGNPAIIRQNPACYFFTIDIDLPLKLELKEYKHQLLSCKIENINYRICHIVKKRGEECFSIFDTKYLPYFSFIQIQGEIPSDFNGNIKTEILIKNILTKLNCFLEDSELEKITNCLPNLPHAVHYINKNTRKIDVYSLFPLTKEISLKGKNEVVNYNENELQKILNSEKLELSNFIETKQQDYAVISDFENKFFSLVHDFAFYSRQHTESIGKLNEESIRDLLLIPIKMVISSHAEGEVFNYDGKSDLKIINPDNKYEYIIGELKWWNSQNSIEELCKQSFEKHVTGQEKTIYLLMLNKNKDISSPLNKCIEYINSLAFTSLKLEQKIISGSKEKFYVGEVTIRNENIPIIFGMFDLYHNKV